MNKTSGVTRSEPLSVEDKRDATPLRSWRLGTMTWCVIAGLILLNVAYVVFFFSGGGTDSHSHVSRLFWFYGDYHHWPEWYAVNLWLIVLGFLVVSLLEKKSIQRRFHDFYASPFWQTGKNQLRESPWNQTFVRFALRKKGRKRILRRWIHLWKRMEVKRYPVYALWCFAILIFCIVFRYSVWLTVPRNFRECLLKYSYML